MKLDGGAAFGVIPKSLWSQRTASRDNLIDFCNNVMVVTAHGKNIMLDCGIGPELSDREMKVYSCAGDSRLEAGLREIGFAPEDIDYLLLTHLHTDHAAGATRTEGDKLVPRFPNATVVASKTEYEAAVNPNERTAAVYRPERYRALERAGVLQLVEPDIELLPGIRLVHTGGHTEGQYIVLLESKGKKMYFFSDLIPSRHHLDVAWVAGLDLFPLDTMAAKRQLLPRIVEEQSVVAFVHDTEMPFARLLIDGKRFVAAAIEDEVTHTA